MKASHRESFAVTWADQIKALEDALEQMQELKDNKQASQTLLDTTEKKCIKVVLDFKADSRLWQSCLRSVNPKAKGAAKAKAKAAPSAAELRAAADID